MRNILLAAALSVVLSNHLAAQPGPPPNPWSYGPSLSLFYNNGEIDIGLPVGAGTLGPGWFNASGGFAINGVALPGAFGSQAPNRVYASPNGASGTPTFRPIASGDLPTNLAVAGTFAAAGATSLANVAVSGTLSAAGAVSGTGFANYMTAGLVSGQPGLFSTLGAGTSLTIGAPGLVGDGVTNNNTALQAAFTAAAAGGKIQIPCGSYVITALQTVTVASGKGFDLGGSGQNCTKILVQGAVGGMTITQADETAGISLHDFTLTTNQAGGQAGITLIKTTANVLNAYAAPLSIQNVSVYGSDYPNSDNPTHYWGQGIILNNVNNVSIFNAFAIGGACVTNLCSGNGINILGNSGLSSYGVVFTISNSNFGLCNTGILYGDWIQGVFINNVNVTGCQYGVATAQAPTGALDELAISNSQFNNFVANIYADTGASGSIGNVQISNSLLLNFANTESIRLHNVTFFTIFGNTFNAVSATGTTAIHILTNSVRGTITGNGVTAYATALKVDASAVTAGTVVANNSFANDTVEYSIGAGVNWIIINDPIFRSIANLFSCQTGTTGSRQFVSDIASNSSPSFHGAVAGGGATTVNSPVYCDGSGTWKWD